MPARHNTTNTADVISVNALDYAYPGASEPALRNISLTVQQGEIFGLLGPSGAGKSTLQRILTRQIRHIRPSSISVLGRPIETWDTTYYEHIGVGFELPNHYLRLTGLENLKFFASLYQSDIKPLEGLLDLVGLTEAMHKKISDYSKGMMIRLNFARAIMHQPTLLFLDEPTTGLDPVTAGKLKSLIQDLKAEGTTIVLTTHNMHDAEALCDRVSFLAQGKITACDAPQALKHHYGERSVTVTARYQDQPISKTFPLDQLGHNTDFLDFITKHQVETIHSQEATLNTVFERVTGMALTPDTPIQRS